jgi:hypothetical protein
MAMGGQGFDLAPLARRGATPNRRSRCGNCVSLEVAFVLAKIPNQILVVVLIIGLDLVP